MSQNNHLVRVWKPSSFMDQRWGRGEETKLKRPLILQIYLRMASLRQGGMLISFFLQSTGGQVYEQRHFSLTVRKRGRILWGRTLWMIMITIQWKASQRNSFNMEPELTSPCNILTKVLINLNRINQSWLYSACGFTLNVHRSTVYNSQYMEAT